MRMSNKKNKKNKKNVKSLSNEELENEEKRFRLHPDTKKSVFAIGFLALALILILARFGKSGPVGEYAYNFFDWLFGVGYFLLPLIFIIMAVVFLTSERRRIFGVTFVGAAAFVLSSLGLIDIFYSDKAGIFGRVVGSIESLFGRVASIIIVVAMIVASFLITLNLPIKIRRKPKESILESEVSWQEENGETKLPDEKSDGVVQDEAVEEIEPKVEVKERFALPFSRPAKIQTSRAPANYVFPPLDLLKSSVEKPTPGDLRANANIIKRTLDSFGIPVEMGEINVGPKVTRYTLKPAEGVKLARITALSSDLSMALAAHPIRIEAPIPGKSLVGIEVPNKAASIVRLGSLMAYPEFSVAGSLGFALGRDVTGEPIFASLEKMPHMLVAGSTGSGKTCKDDTYVFSEKGMLTFSEICPLPLNSEMDFKVKVATRDGMEETSKNYNNGICNFYKIETSEGYSVEVTAEHPLWKIDKEGMMGWEAGANIKVNDYVAISRGAELFGDLIDLKFEPPKNKTNKAAVIKLPKEMTPELGLFLGLLTADGGLTVKNRIVYTQANNHLLLLYQGLLKDLFSITSSIVNKSKQNNKAKDIIVRSLWLKEFLKYLGMDSSGSPKKEIPLFIRMSRPEVIKAFLQGLMRNDAHLSEDSLELCVSSHDLVKQTQLILLNFGIISSIHAKKVKTYPDRIYWRLSIYGNELIKYYKKIGFLTKEEENKIQNILLLKRNPNKDLIPNMRAIFQNLKIIYRNSFAKITNSGWVYRNNVLVPKYSFANLKSYNSGERSPSYLMLDKILDFYKPVNNTKEYQQLENIKSYNFYWAKIKSITKTKGEGYDFEVPGSNSFVGNGFVNHNSVSIHSLLLSLLYKNSPDNLKMILIDPKRVELTAYSGIPHLIAPVVTESKKSLGVFKWALKEMDGRYEILESAGSRDIKSYNKKNPDNPLPFIIIVIDELADLMSTYGREVEGSVVRLAQMARATGIHLILATQRPSVEVITGLIKANITTRIALQVASQIDSRTILDSSGAEKLLGGGDMLYVSSDLSKPRRIQGAYVSEEEINKVTQFIRENNSDYVCENAPTFENGLTSSSQGGSSDGLFDGFEEDEDEFLEEAIRIVSEAQKASASLLQRRLKVGYARAARLLDIMEAKGIIGPGDGAKPREVYVKREI